MIIWPESLLERPFEENNSFFAKNPQRLPLLPFLAAEDLYLLTGAPLVLDREQHRAANGTLLIAPDGRVLRRYAKQHLVPFAEEIPFADTPLIAAFMRDIVKFEAPWTRGSETVIMDLPLEKGAFRFATPICFEDAFAGLCRKMISEGAEALINVTNDAWSRRVSAEIQHMAASRFRTVENRRVLVRGANAGFTAIISAEGRILAFLPCFEEGFLAAELPVQRSPHPTVYTMLGDWLPELFCLLLFIMLCLSRRGTAK
jgi:apolipoprotein N-acyltransferase